MIDNLIYEINKAQSDSNINVILSFVHEYDKYFTISKNTDNCINVIQESDDSTADKAKKGLFDRIKERGKDDDSKLITYLKFIPRLVIELFRPLIEFFKNGKLGQSFKNIDKTIYNAKTIDEKKAKVKYLNKMFDGNCECYYDEKTKKVKMKKTKKGLMNDLIWVSELVFSLLTFRNQWEKIKHAKTCSSIVRLFDDIEVLLKGGKISNSSLETKYNLFDDGVSALSELMSDMTASMALLDSITRALQSIIEGIARRDIIKDEPDEKKQELLTKAHSLVSQITKVTTRINLIVIALKPFKEWGKVANNEFASVVEISNNEKEARIRLYIEILKETPDYDAMHPVDINNYLTALQKHGLIISLNIKKKLPKETDETHEQWMRRLAEEIDKHKYYPKEYRWFTFKDNQKRKESLQKLIQEFDGNRIYGLMDNNIKFIPAYKLRYKEILDSIKNAGYEEAERARIERKQKQINDGNNQGDQS